MSESKPLNEIPAARTRRVLRKLRIPEGSTIAWLGAAVLIVVAGLLVLGFLVGVPAADIFRNYVDRLRGLGE